MAFADMMNTMMGRNNQNSQSQPQNQNPQGNQGNPQSSSSFQNQPGNQNSGGTNPVNPGTTTGSNDPNNMKQVDPFEMYKELFTPADPSKTPKAPAFSLSDDIVNKAASGMDFTAGIPPELKARLESGESLDGKTVLELLNHSSRNAYTKSMQHLSSLTDRFVNLHSDFSKQGLSKEVQRVLANNSITKIPGADNPVMRGFLEMTSNALASKYPDQTPEWVADKTKELFLTMAKTMRGQEQPEPTDPKDLTQDPEFSWDGFLSGKPNQLQ